MTGEEVTAVWELVAVILGALLVPAFTVLMIAIGATWMRRWNS